MAGAEAGAAETEAGAETVAESLKKVNKLLTEEKILLNKKLNERTQKYQNRWVDALIESVKPDVKNKSEEKVKIYNKNVKINEGIDSMIKDIDKMLDE